MTIHGWCRMKPVCIAIVHWCGTPGKHFCRSRGHNALVLLTFVVLSGNALMLYIVVAHGHMKVSKCTWEVK